MLCPICRQIHVLCQVCEAKLSEGELTKAEIRLDRLMASRGRELQVVSAFDVGKRLVIVVEPGEADKVRDLWKEYVVFEENGVDVAKILSPVRLRKTRVFLPDGTENERLVAGRGELSTAGFDVDKLEEALGKLLPEGKVKLI